VLGPRIPSLRGLLPVWHLLQVALSFLVRRSPCRLARFLSVAPTSLVGLFLAVALRLHLNNPRSSSSSNNNNLL
jgi:hypothetical protein